MNKTREHLLKELEDCRWFAMYQLADEADETGNGILAFGWRWLANNKKWPYTIGRDAYFVWDHDDNDCSHDENCLPNQMISAGINSKRLSSITEFMFYSAQKIGQYYRDTGSYPE